MITVGIRNLKDSLSRYLKMVRGGEHIMVTDRNRIIAEIVPAPVSPGTDSRLSQYVAEQTEKGTLLPATKRTVLSPSRGKQRVAQDDVQRILQETREDRG